MFDGMLLLQRQFKQEILGSIVLTIYNNKTYQVDDVDFSVTPATMFNWNGVWTSYADYFSQVCALC
jgi:aubergine-like protein